MSFDKARFLATPPSGESAGQNSSQSHTRHAISDRNFSQGITSVGGVLLTTLNSHETNSKPTTNATTKAKGSGKSSSKKQASAVTTTPVDSDLVLVASTRRNRYCVALAVASGGHILLEGPVGCGKTALVEHLANQVGRTGPPQLTKVQLGDQIDSKVSMCY